jgi:hypothetical protein
LSKTARRRIDLSAAIQRHIPYPINKDDFNAIVSFFLKEAVMTKIAEKLTGLIGNTPFPARS